MPFLGGIDSGSVPSPGRNVASGNDAPNPVPAIPAAISGSGIDSGGTPMPGQILPGSFTPPIVVDPLGSRTSSLLTSAWSQGGNAFGAAGVLGTTDANPLSIITNNITRFSLDLAGNLTNLRGFLGWSATSPPAALGELGMNVVTGRATLFVGGVVQQVAVLGDLPGGGAATFPPTLTSASAQYTTLPTDRLIEVDVSGGQLAGPILFDANATVGTTHTVATVGGNPSANPIGVNGNGQTIENPSSLQTFSAGTVVITQVGAVTWMKDANGRWKIIASA